MLRLSTSIVGLALASLFAAAPAAADSDIFGLGFHGGYGEAKDATSGSGLVGMHAEYRPSHSIGIIWSVAYVFEEDVTVDSAAGDEIGSFTASNVPLTVMARFYLPIETLRPYGAAGASWNFINYDANRWVPGIRLVDDSETAFGWLLAAGAQYDTSDKVGVFGEMRWEFIDAQRELENESGASAEESDYDRWNAVGGITFYF